MLNGDAAALLIWSACFTVVGGAIGAARLYVRAAIVRSLRLDDSFLLLAILVGIAGYITMVIYANRILSNFTTSTSQIQESPFRFEAESFNQGMICAFTLQNTLARVSLVLSYKRFTPDSVRHWARIVMIILLMFVTGIGFVTLFLSAVPCWPPHGLINTPTFYREIEQGRWKCLEPRQVFFWYSVAIVLPDLAIWIFPFRLLKGVNLQKKQKIGLYILFAFGGAVFIISIFRILFMASFRQKNIAAVDPLTDVTNIWIFTIVEANGIIIAASVPILRPLGRKIRGLFTTSVISWTSRQSGTLASGKYSSSRPTPADEIEMQRRVEDV